MPNVTTGSTTSFGYLRAERDRRVLAAGRLDTLMAHDLTIHVHRAAWSSHPVPWCSGPCPGGETWPCPPIRAAAARLNVTVPPVLAGVR